ncbi:MAG: bifunctional folylpolyglutamate synthase/dihydrofolate synthase, partial [Verrucomicrobia bacterium]|nr:bifunctional folylpolyglutamate synthase/dihydrofolate synthase [Verrucomicrobiota bacterium]
LMDTASGSDCSSGGMEHTAVVATHRLPFLHQDSRRLATNQYEICGLEDPHDRIPCFHIAGTNGKGSVSAFAASILKAAGLRVGLYTSPHLVDFRERIQINGEMISQEDLEKGIKRLQAATQTGKEMPTFFELTTALAFDYFARQQCDVIVLETGLGGRLDATNVASNKIACAITPISMDHQALLGSTLSAIAREKAGIIRAGIPVVTSPQPEEVMNVLQEKAKQLYAPLEIISEPISPEIPLGLLGSYQRWNAAVALALVQQGPWKLSPEAIAEGLATTSWPGRFQRWKTKNGQEMILDGAHNPAAAEQLVATWKEVFPGQKCELIFGALADKEGEAMLRILEPISASINLVSVHSPRTSSPAELQKILPLATTFSSLEEVFKKKKFFVDKIFGFSTDLQPPVLLTGSLFLVGEGLALLQGRSHSSFSQ